MDEIEKVILNDTSLQLADTTARTIATDAKQAVDGITVGFNTQFEQKHGNYISPYFCKRNNTVYVEFPNITPTQIIPHGVWVEVCYVKTIHKPLSTIYRDITVGGTITVVVEINTNGTMKMFSPTTDIPLNGYFFGGFSYLTI